MLASLIFPSAHAQAATPGGTDLMAFLPMIAIFVVFYFLLIRPQQKRAKETQDMISSIRRGDTVVTTGGIIGKVTKVTDGAEVEVEIAPNVKVRVLRQMVAEVRSKGEPVKDAAA